MAKKKTDYVQLFCEAWDGFDCTVGDRCFELYFHPERRWRFDIAWESNKVAIEIDGQGYGHQSIKGRISDCEKQNAALVMGWRVFRFSTAQLNSEAKIEAAVLQVWNFMTDEVNEW